MTTSSHRRLRIGVLGAARIARLFIESVRPSTKVEVTAIASRDVGRATAFAQDLGIDRVHASYDALLADADVDAVYLPLPNSLHAKWSIRALDARKHVLCEKPLAASAAEARAMFAAAEKNGVFLVEAYPYRAQAQTLKVRELIAAGAIGNIQIVHASFGFPLNDAANIRMDRGLAGGSLMDAGSYPVSFVRTVVGAAPSRVSAVARWSETGVDLATLGTLEYPDGLLAQISCSFTTARHRNALIVGDAGSISTTYFNDTGPTFPPLVHLRRGSGWDAQHDVIETDACPGFLAEAESFHDLVRGGWRHWTGATPAESIDIAMTLEALASSSRQGVPIVVA